MTFSPLLRPRCSVAVFVTTLAATSAAFAEAPPDRATCDAAYEQGQRLRRNKKLLAARERFVLCARDPCPTAFQGECARWFGEVSSELPTVVIEVRRGGTLAPTARVLLDGATFLDEVDGVARPVDPGPHEFTIVPPGGKPLVQRETVLEGVKAQRFVFDVEPAPEAPAARRGPPSPLVIGLGALGGLAAVSFGYFGITGMSERAEIERCSPNCAREDVDAGQRSLLIADISAGVALVSLSAAAVLYFTQGSGSGSAGRRASGTPPFVWRW